MQALEDLDYLAALDDNGDLSDLGVILSEFPLPPELAKALLASCEFDCVDEMLTLAAMLTGITPLSLAPAPTSVLPLGVLVLRRPALSRAPVPTSHSAYRTRVNSFPLLSLQPFPSAGSSSQHASVSPIHYH